MFRCPACGEMLEALTNVHCKVRHCLTRAELIMHYGAPEFVMPSIGREVQQWIHDAQVIRRVDFELAQAAARNQRRH